MKNLKKKRKRKEKQWIPGRNGQYKSAQSAILGLPIWGASTPTSLQKFQASNATLTFGFLIPGSPIADMYFSEAKLTQLAKLRSNTEETKRKQEKE